MLWFFVPWVLTIALGAFAARVAYGTPSVELAAVGAFNAAAISFVPWVLFALLVNFVFS